MIIALIELLKVLGLLIMIILAAGIVITLIAVILLIIIYTAKEIRKGSKK